MNCPNCLTKRSKFYCSDCANELISHFRQNAQHLWNKKHQHQCRLQTLIEESNHTIQNMNTDILNDKISMLQNDILPSIHHRNQSSKQSNEENLSSFLAGQNTLRKLKTEVHRREEKCMLLKTELSQLRESLISQKCKIFAQILLIYPIHRVDDSHCSINGLVIHDDPQTIAYEGQTKSNECTIIRATMTYLTKIVLTLSKYYSIPLPHQISFSEIYIKTPLGQIYSLSPDSSQFLYAIELLNNDVRNICAVLLKQKEYNGLKEHSTPLSILVYTSSCLNISH